MLSLDDKTIGSKEPLLDVFAAEQLTDNNANKAISEYLGTKQFIFKPLFFLISIITLPDNVIHYLGSPIIQDIFPGVITTGFSEVTVFR